MEFQLSLPEPRPADPQALAAWLGQTLHVELAHAKIRLEKPKKVIWDNIEYQQPVLWQITLRNPKRMLQAEYWAGNAFVSIKQSDGNLWSLLSNLHKGTGMGIAWVLLVDTLAGGLVVLSLTGTLLWTRLHGGRLLAAGLGLGCLSLILGLTIQAIAP